MNFVNWVFEKLLARRVRETIAASEEYEDVEWDNPNLDPATAQAIYMQFDHSLHALWPVLATDPSSAGSIAYSMVHGTIESFLDRDDDMSGVVVEMCRLVYSHLPERFDVAHLPAIAYVHVDDEVGNDRSAKVAAFIDATLEGNLEGACNVLAAHMSDYEEGDSRYAHMIGMMTLILNNVSWVYATNTYGPSN